MTKDQYLLGTWELSKILKISHRSIKDLIRTFKDDFAEVSERPVSSKEILDAFRKTGTPTREKGRPIEEYVLSEKQVLYLIVLLHNNDAVRDLKKNIIKSLGKTPIGLILDKAGAASS
jgi:hypothetical protein